MYGAVIGDLAGSIYEYDQLKKINPIKMDKVIPDNAFYSDDTILTVAICEAALNGGNYATYLRKYIKEYENYRPNFSPYFKSPFSPNIMKWANSSDIGTSLGNGAMMRISAIGYLFDTEEEVIKEAALATRPSHNSKEALSAATIIALMIFYFRKGLSKKEVYDLLNLSAVYRPFVHFNTTCRETLSNVLYAIFYSTSFSDAVRLTLLMGGDTDTNLSIVASVCEVLYGISDDLIKEAEARIPEDFSRILRKVK